MRSRLHRRSFLGQAIASGAILQLPFMMRARPARAAAPLNFLTVFVPDGVIPSLWHPMGGETGFTLPTMSQPLEPVKGDIIFLKGLSMYAGEPTHPGGTKKVLTATAAQSLDIYLGQKLKGSLPFDSLQLGVASNFENGSGAVSFIGKGQEVKPDDNPLNVFSRLFGGAAPTPTGGGAPTMDPDALLRARQKKSLLDTIRGDLTSLQSKLGTAEKSRLDNHLSALRDVEARAAGVSMPNMGGSGGGTTPGPTGPVAACDKSGFNKQGYKNTQSYYPQTYHVADNFPTVGQLQMDLAVLALSCNLSRVVTLMWSHAVSPTKIPGVTTIGNHDSSHYGTNPGSATGMQYIANRRWYMGQFAGLLQRMKATPYGDSNLLDHTVVYLCTDINDGDLHDHRSMPFLLAGGSKAGLRTGRSLDFTNKGQGGQNETHAKLLVSIARALGDPLDSYGYTAMGTGGLAGL
jgi:hypothetical protein